ncbi:uncharacterized protein JCM15063_003731 [Sporobolomyces koalae]|uniref:uncharacterized protein n=1 Tax=Sporobolomyces koalae TaxID=500713 RepID=UPI0031760D6A
MIARYLEDGSLPSGERGESAQSKDRSRCALNERTDPLTLTSPRLLSLPTEILCAILDQIPLDRTLARCCLVSRKLLPLAHARLYRTLVLRSSTRGSALSASADTILDARSTRILDTVIESSFGVFRYPTRIDFDLNSHFTASQIGATLAVVLASCPNCDTLRLGKGDRGHGMPFSALSEMLAQFDPRVPLPRIKVLNLEECVGNGTTLARVLVRLPHLVELRLGQFLLEPSDWTPPSLLPTFRLQTFVAKYSLTRFAFAFCTASSGDTLRKVDVPINERNGLELSHCTSLVDVSLFLSLSPSLTTTTTQTSYFSNKRSNLSMQSLVTTAGPSLVKLGQHFRSTLSSLSHLVSHLSIKGNWDTGDPEPLDIVRHGRLLFDLPPSLECLSIETELNSIALVEWLDSIVADKGDKRQLHTLRIWQKTTFSSMKRDFQRMVREKVSDKAREAGGIVCEWHKYEKW